MPLMDIAASIVRLRRRLFLFVWGAVLEARLMSVAIAEDLGVVEQERRRSVQVDRPGWSWT